MDQEQKEYFMNEALKEAKLAFDAGEIPIGCVLVYQGKIIGRGHNLRQASQQAIDHAEILAISQANQQLASWRLAGCQLFVTLEPCPMCAGAILNARIDEVYYGVADLKAGVAGTLMNLLNDGRFNHQAYIEKGILEDKCLSILQTFFKRVRKEK